MTWKSIKKEDFLIFIDMLCEHENICRGSILLDNCSVHRSRLVKEEMGKRGLKIVWNLPYRPEFNGIEGAWALMKAHYRKLLLRNMIVGRSLRLKEIVE